MAAVGVKKLLSEHCLVHDGSVGKAAFKAYLKDVLLPQLEPNSILVTDHWRAKLPEGTVHHGDIRES